MLKKALDKNFFSVEFVNFREYSKNRFKRVDTPLVGGGAGMIIDNIALRNCLIDLKSKYKNVEFKSATLFYKKTSIYEPDFWINETTKWIEFFWEIDLINKG